MRILFAADLHIGRASTRIPAAANSAELRARAVWERIVDLVITESVDLVLLAGDITDKDNKYWEAIGPLEQGTKRLAAAGVQTLAVSGNHDHDVLVRLARNIPPEQFTLVGQSGKWQRYTVKREGRAVLHVDGWSFPTEHVPISPLDSYDLPLSTDLPVIGMVHGDLGQPASQYAPLSQSFLESQSVDGWLLGHIHAPCLCNKAEAPWILYPGSPQALDPGEPGEHGVWLGEVKDQKIAPPTFRPLSSVWYGPCEIDVSGVTTREQFEAELIKGVQGKVDEVRTRTGSELRFVSLRLRVVGTTEVAEKASSYLEGITDDLSLVRDDVEVVVEKAAIDVLPPLDLVDLARSSSALGVVAQLLLELENGQPSEAAEELLREVQNAVTGVDRKKDFAALPDSQKLEPDELSGYLRRQARRLLSTLSSQDS